MQNICHMPDKNQFIPMFWAVLMKWDQNYAPRPKPVGPAATQSSKERKVAFKPAAVPSTAPIEPRISDKGKGKQRAVSPVYEEDGEEGDGGEDDEEDYEDEMVSVEKVRSGVKRKHESGPGGSAHSTAPTAQPAPKRKRIQSAEYIEDSDVEQMARDQRREVHDVDMDSTKELEVAGINPKPCEACLERNIQCEWLTDTTKKACRLCVKQKMRCTTMAENKEALRELREALELSTSAGKTTAPKTTSPNPPAQKATSSKTPAPKATSYISAPAPKKVAPAPAAATSSKPPLKTMVAQGNLRKAPRASHPPTTSSSKSVGMTKADTKAFVRDQVEKMTEECLGWKKAVVDIEKKFEGEFFLFHYSF